MSWVETALTVWSDVWGREGPYSRVQCIMGNGHMGNTPPPDTYENSFPQLRWRVVNLTTHACLYIGVNKHIEIKVTSKNKPTQQTALIVMPLILSLNITCNVKFNQIFLINTYPTG